MDELPKQRSVGCGAARVHCALRNLRPASVKMILGSYYDTWSLSSLIEGRSAWSNILSQAGKRRGDLSRWRWVAMLEAPPTLVRR